MVNNKQIQKTNLDNWDIIQVSGTDAAFFLHNQLTVSVTEIKQAQSVATKSRNQLRLAGYCSPKGRLLASLWISHPETPSEDTFYLWVSKDIATSLAKRLQMFVMRSKVKIHYDPELFHLTALFGPEKTVSDLLETLPLTSIALPEVRLGASQFERAIVAMKPSNQPSTELESIPAALIDSEWDFLEVMSGIPRVIAATQDQFVPQMVNFESVGGIDFKKGCYPGQEVVARSQYRGAIKRRLQIAYLVQDSNLSDFQPQPGDEVYSADDLAQPAGMVVLSAIDPNMDRLALQIELKIESAPKKIMIKTATGFSSNLVLGEIPYSLLVI